MENLREIGSRVIFNFDDFSLSVSQGIVLLIGVLFIYFLNTIAKRIIGKSIRFRALSERLRMIIKKGVGYFIWIVGLLILFKIERFNTKLFFAYEIFSSDKVSITVQKIFILLVVIFIVRLFILIVEYSLNRKFDRDNIEFGKGKSIIQITKYFIWFIGVFIAIGSLGLQLTFIIASVSALLVGVGFGLQNIFNDFFSGIIILFDGSLKVNDVVQVGDIVGRVKEIGVRTTKVLNRDNIILIIPNSKFTADNVINWSHMDQKSRFAVPVGVAYGSDVQLVETLLLECAAECKDVVKTPKPFVRFEDFGSSSLDFKLYFWTNNSFFVENTKSALRFLIDKKFRENKVTIPFPQRDVHIKNSN